MPQSKQTTDLILSLRAIVYRLRQLTKERRGYSKAKHRELARLLREGQEDLARIKCEDVIANDNLIIALEILELHCERIHVRANILDHLVAQKGVGGRNSPRPRSRARTPQRPQSGQARAQNQAKRSSGGSWSLWKALGFGSSSPSPPPQTQSEQPATPQDPEQAAAEGKGSTQPSTPSDANKPEDPSTPPPPERDVYLDPELDKAAAAIFYSYARIPRDIPGLLELRAKLVHRWGNEFALKAQEGDPSIVEIPRDLIERLRLEKPPESLIDNYLREIARSHRIPYHGETWEEEEEEEEVRGGDGNEAAGSTGGGNQDSNGSTTGSGDGQNSSSSGTAGGEGKATSPEGGVPGVDELARRFAALKR